MLPRAWIAFCLAGAVALATLTAPGPARAEIVKDSAGHRLGVTAQIGVRPSSLPGALAATAPAGTSSTSGTLTWNNGPVLHSSAPYLIYWTPSGTSIPGGWQSLLQRYFTDVAADSGGSGNVYGVARQYTDATGYADYRQTFSPSQIVLDTGAYPARDTTRCPNVSSAYPQCITDQQLQAELQRELAAAGLPGDGASSSQLPAGAPIYFVVLPSDVNVCDTTGGQITCANNSFCAYHSYFSDSANHQDVLYAAIPTVILASGENPKACQYDGNAAVQRPNSTNADVVVKYVSHEDNEAITDPLLNAWYDPSSGNENGDDCNAYGTANPSTGTNPSAFTPVLGGSASGTLYNQLIDGNQYYLQSEWSNGDGGCRMQPTTATLAPSFTAPPATVAPGTTITFDPAASSPSSGYSSATWDFGDGTTARFNRGSQAMAQATHTYHADGTYTVSLTVVDTHGNLATTTRQVQIDEPPHVTMQVTSATPGAGQPTAFAATAGDADGTIGTYAWNFGDGTAVVSGSSATASHTYQTAGTYTVSLTVTDSDGQTASSSQVVTVAGPTPQFSSTPAVEGATMTVDGSASTDSPSNVAITSYTWNFGDGSTETDATPTATHVYAQHGQYWITLTVTDAADFTSSVSQLVTIADETPAAQFAVTGSPGSGLPTTFDAGGSSDGDGSITGYSWDFGDHSPVVSGATPAASHVYAGPGTYTVSLTVTDSDGQTSRTSSQLTVAGPTASFTAPASGSDVTPLTFDGSASSPGAGGGGLSYAWSADDHWSASGPLAGHTFAQPGAHTVTLTVTNGLGQSASASRVVNVVDEPPTAAFSQSTGGTLSIGEPIAFTGTASSDPDGAVAGYSWQFGDHTSGTGASPTHAYQAAGTYLVTLVVTDSSGGSSAAASHWVTVHAPPAPAFSVAGSHPVAGVSVRLDGTSSSDSEPGVALGGWSWSFGDGGSATGATPWHTFARPGLYRVTLQVTNALGLSATTTQLIAVAAAGRVSKLGLQSASSGPILLVTVTAGGRLRVGSHTIRITRPGTARVRLSLSRAQLRTLVAHGTLRLRTSVRFAPVIGPSTAQQVTFMFRLSHRTRRRYTVALLHR